MSRIGRANAVANLIDLDELEAMLSEEDTEALALYFIDLLERAEEDEDSEDAG